MPTKLLYLDLLGAKSLPDAAALNVAARGYEVIGVSDLSAARAIINSSSHLSLIISNVADLNLLREAKAKFPQLKVMLMTEDTMEQYSHQLHGKEAELLDHVIANRYPQSEWTAHEMRTTLQKLLTDDIFGIDKYLAMGAEIRNFEVKRSDERDYLNNQVLQYADQSGLSLHIGKLAFAISEEMLMNAIYDAPMQDGQHRYGSLPRTVPVNLEPHEQATLSIGCDNLIFAISVSDPFGSLRRETFLAYLRKVLKRHESSDLIDTKQGGAGLGLFKILYSCHSMVCNVKAGSKTEVMALIDIRQQLRDFSKMARSIHFFDV